MSLTMLKSPDTLKMPVSLIVSGYTSSFSTAMGNPVLSVNEGSSQANFSIFKLTGANNTGTLTAKTESATLKATGAQAASGQNAYLLPWSPNYACIAGLGASHEYFITHNLNGCGILIAGTRTNPVVVHANTQVGWLDQGEPDFDKFRTRPMHELTAAMDKYRKTIRWPQMTALYTVLASKLIAQGELDGATLAMFTPMDYMDTGLAAVWGIKKSGGWEFFASTNNAVRTIWPE